MKRLLFILLLFTPPTLAQNNIFDFKIDKRLFISYAFMNAAGNDAEWRKEGMNSIRIEVRKDLFSKIDSTFLKDIQSYVNNNHLESWTTFGPYALINDGPPNFNLNINYSDSNVDSNFINKTKGLRKYFIEFYNQYDIEELWNKYNPIIQKENQEFEPYANKALKGIIKYCRLDNNYYAKKTKRIYFQRIPLMLYYTMQTVKINGEIYIISGPMEDKPTEASFYHEALHYPVGELVKKYSNEVDKYSKLNDLNKGKLGYQDWKGFFEECLVRTIDRILSAKLFNYNDSALAKNIYDEFKLGMFLCPYFEEELNKYEKTNLTLEEYFPQLLTNLDYDKEKKRLENFNQKRQ